MAFKITKIIANYGGCDLPQVLRLEVAYDNKALESVVTLEFDEDPFPTIRTFDGQPRDLRIDIARENT
ncbi:MAG TPA: hypothetical protein VEJ63_06795, partial [Planctomycetota bacterium]|nr:hypothetical protein [Planctomycetota bacterium]